MSVFPLSREEIREHFELKQEIRRREMRDAFATAALTGIMSSAKIGPETKVEDIAGDAYAVADAMLVERERRG